VRSTVAQPAPRGVAALGLLVALGGGLYGAAFWLTVDEGPSAEAIAEAAKPILDGHRAGDLILVVPHFATRVYEHVGHLGPLAVKAPLREDLDGHQRIWVFGIFGDGEPLVDALTARGLELAERFTTPAGTTVALLNNPGANTIRYDFLARLRDAKVFHEKNGTRTACSEWTSGRGGAGRWQCPYDKDWFYVAPEYHLMGDHSRLCLWAHPPGEGRLIVEYPRVPLAGRLYGRAGHTLNGSLNARAPIDLDVAFDGGPPQRFVFELEDYFEPFYVRTATAGTATVSFAISTVDAGVNHFCFTADIRTAEELAP
jgi:hypothetical protein